MKCVHINIRGATFVILSVLLNGVKHSQMADNHMDLSRKDSMPHKNTSNNDLDLILNVNVNKNLDMDEVMECHSDAACSSLNYPCITCSLNSSCGVYGAEMNVTCKVQDIVQCKGERIFEKKMLCRYCYQTEVWEHNCDLKANCNCVATPRSYYKTNCTVKNDIICLGRRTFPKNVLCNWTGGYRWTTALALSITLGGFGADRFYLGHWQEGIGKLFSFGGLGVWTLIDVILISLHYLGPADGSLYI